MPCDTLGVLLLEGLQLIERDSIEVARLDILGDVGCIVVFTNRADVERIAVFRNLPLARVLVSTSRRPALGPQALLVATALRRAAITLGTIIVPAVGRTRTVALGTVVTLGTVSVSTERRTRSIALGTIVTLGTIGVSTERRTLSITLRTILTRRTLVVATERRTRTVTLGTIVTLETIGVSTERRTLPITLRTILARRTLVVATEGRTLPIARSTVRLAGCGSTLGGTRVVVTTSAGVRTSGALSLGTLASWPPVAVSGIAHDVSCFVVCDEAS